MHRVASNPAASATAGAARAAASQPLLLGAGLRALAVGSRLQGTVAGAAADGGLRILFAAGEAILRGAEPLPAGSRLALRITALDPEIRATVRVVQLASAPASATTATAGGCPPPPAGGHPAAATPAAPNAGQTMRAAADPPALAVGGEDPAAAEAAGPTEPVAAMRRLLEACWVALPIPVDPPIRRGRLLLRQDVEMERRAPAVARDRRFVVEVSLPRLGRVQLDALLPGGEPRLELILRSERAVSDCLADDLRRLARSAGERAGLATALAFRAAPPAFVEPQVAPPPPSPRRGVLA